MLNFVKLYSVCLTQLFIANNKNIIIITKFLLKLFSQPPHHIPLIAYPPQHTPVTSSRGRRDQRSLVIGLISSLCIQVRVVILSHCCMLCCQYRVSKLIIVKNVYLSSVLKDTRIKQYYVQVYLRKSREPVKTVSARSQH